MGGCADTKPHDSGTPTQWRTRRLLADRVRPTGQVIASYSVCVRLAPLGWRSLRLVRRPVFPLAENVHTRKVALSSLRTPRAFGSATARAWWLRCPMARLTPASSTRSTPPRVRDRCCTYGWQTLPLLVRKSARQHSLLACFRLKDGATSPALSSCGTRRFSSNRESLYLVRKHSLLIEE